MHEQGYKPRGGTKGDPGGKRARGEESRGSVRSSEKTFCEYVKYRFSLSLKKNERRSQRERVTVFA